MHANTAVAELEPPAPRKRAYQRPASRSAVSAALPAPWERPGWRPGDDPMADLPAERGWEARRARILLEMRTERAVCQHCLGLGRAVPGKPFLYGRRIARHMASLDTAIALWAGDLAAGEPPENTPRSYEVLYADRGERA